MPTAATDRAEPLAKPTRGEASLGGPLVHRSRRAAAGGRVRSRLANRAGLMLMTLAIAAATMACGGGGLPILGGGDKPTIAIEGTMVFTRWPDNVWYRDLYLLDVQGARLLASHGDWTFADPAWSPDGTKIAYITDTMQLAVVNRDGSGGATLTPKSSDPQLWSYGPAWLPDGNISIRVGGKLAVLRPDGSGVRVLPSDSTTVAFPIEHAWSPDGAQVVYGCGKSRDNISLSHFWAAVCIFDVQSGATRKLLEPPGPQSVPSLGALAWSPAGNTILALVDNDVERDLYVFDASGRGWRALAQPGIENDPAWSPDGKMIVYESHTADQTHSRRTLHLWVMNADGSGAQPLYADGAEPDWTTD